jgi:hypothetical protein
MDREPGMNWKVRIKHAIPVPLLNALLLTFPFLHRTKLVCYETTLQENHGIDELLMQLSMVLGIRGDIIECGSSRCGASIIMANYLRSKHVHRIIYACDSFEGFNPIELDRERQAGLTEVSDGVFTSTSYEYVKRKIEKLGVEDMVVPIKGFFQDTLPQLESNFCFALIDCDLRESIIYCAEAIWPKLMSDGRIVFDDYTSEFFRGARLGIEFFVNKYGREISEHGLMNRLYYVCKK